MANDIPECYCGWCGSLLVLRTNSKTKTKFWGCSKWPECKATYALNAPAPIEDTEPEPCDAWMDMSDDLRPY